MPTYAIRLAKEQFVFSAAHFITFNGNICERLHGHNYRTAVEMKGPLDENSYVLDFIAVRDALLRIVARLDHRVLLPSTHPLIRVVASGREVTATFQDRRWVFPAEDCVLLPVANTTAELLARFIGEQLQAELAPARLGQLQVSVDECDGQIGVCRWEEL